MKIPESICNPKNRYDFVVLFDVQDGNPNGDPDAGNLPRVDPETMQGIVTDVCLKRKIRNYVDMAHESSDNTENDNGIFVRNSGIALNTKLKKASEEIGEKPNKKIANKNGREEMCRRYYDIRMFGGVLTTGDYNCGQVRGPMQLTFSRSIDPVIPSDLTITRVAITKEGDEKETEMGRKAYIPYGLYRCYGFFSPSFAEQTKVSAEDLNLFWEAVLGMFENDRSASRGFMQLQGVYIFAHENPLGNAPSGKLFERIFIKSNSETPRKFSDYTVEVSNQALPSGVTMEPLLS